MNLDEIKKNIFQKVHENGELDRIKEDFYVASGAKRIQIRCGGNVLDLLSTVLTGGYGIDSNLPVTTVSLDTLSSDNLMKLIKEYSDSLSMIEKQWNSVVREANIADKKQDLSKIGLEAVVKSIVGDSGIRCEVNTTGNKTKITIGNASITLPADDTHIIDVARQFAEKAKKAFGFISVGSDEWITERVYQHIDRKKINWYLKDAYDFDKQTGLVSLQEKWDRAIKTGLQMSFTPVPNTIEDIEKALAAVNINVEVIDSPYCHGTKALKVTSGEFSIIITSGKLQGMLVACSQFFCLDKDHTVNICVSHRPLQQVVDWIMMACQNIQPVADKLIPTYRKMLHSLEQKDETRRVMLDICAIRGVSCSINEFRGISCDVTIEGASCYAKAYVSVDIFDAEPLKTAQNNLELVKFMKEITQNS